MSGPPTDIPPSELWLALQAEPFPSEVVDFPRYRDGKALGKVRIRTLAMEAHDICRIRGFNKTKARAGVEKDDLNAEVIREVQGDAVARELLWMATLRVEDCSKDPSKKFYPQFFPSPEAIEKTLTADELTVLFTQYQLIQAKYGPYEGSISSERELNAWIERLAEGAAAFPLARLSLPQLADLTSLLARRNFTLLRLLASQWESLPSTLTSAPEISSFDIGYFGEPRDEGTQAGFPNDAIDLEQARELARDLVK